MKVLEDTVMTKPIIDNEHLLVKNIVTNKLKVINAENVKVSNLKVDTNEAIHVKRNQLKV